MPRPSHSPWFVLPNNIWWWVQIMKLPTVQLSLFSRYFIPLRSKYSPQYSYPVVYNISRTGLQRICKDFSLCHRVQIASEAVRWLLEESLRWPIWTSRLRGSLFVLGRFRVRFAARWRPILTEVFRDFFLTFPCNSQLISTATFHILSNSLFPTHIIHAILCELLTQ
jgi:hypothetical protein